MKLVKKYMVGLFVKGDNGEWVRITKSTTFDLSLNPDVQERDYIADMYPSKEIDKYAPTLNQSIVMYKGSADYELIFPLAYGLKTGAQAQKDVLIVFMQEPVLKNATFAEADDVSEANFSNGEYYVLDGTEYSLAEEFDENETYYTKTGGTVLFKAWQTNATISVANINTVDSTITCDINFGGKIEKGVAEPVNKKPVFTKTEEDEGDFIDPFV